jgi:hypothetical protein
MEVMGKIWVLDTETKGTGAEMVPLEKVLRTADPGRGPVVVKPKAEPSPSPAAEPKQPPRFKVVDVMTDQVLLEGADLRSTLDLLEEKRSLVDVRVHLWDDDADRWRRLSLGEHKALWRLRGHGRSGAARR